MAKKNHNQFVRCVENIQDLSGQELYDYALVLAGGGAFSRKTIRYDSAKDIYHVDNHIDGSKQRMTRAKLLASNIGKGMKKRCLIAIIP